MEIISIVKKDFLIFDDESTLSSMIGKLKQFEKRSGLVFRNKKYLGLIEKKRLLKSRLDTSEAKIKNFIEKTPILNENADVIETAYLMFQSNLDFLPVETDKEIVGVITALDLASLGLSLPEADGWKISDLKLLKPRKVNKDDPLATAIDILYKERIDQVPIYDQGKLFGILSYRDLLRRYLNWSPKRDVSKRFNTVASTKSAESDMPNLAVLPAESFSTNDHLVSILSSGSVKEAVNLMLKNNVSCLPVIENEDFLGLLTVNNVLRKIASLKVPQNFNIRFVGLNNLKLLPHQKYSLRKIAANEAFKLQRQIRKDFQLTMHLKAYEKEGGRQKFSVNLRIEFPGQMIASSQEDWTLETAVRKTFNNAKNKVESKFKR